MGNNVPCKLVGIDSIQIKMHDGIVRTLIDVCQVPKLKKNLVFVDVMDSKGFSCKVREGRERKRGGEEGMHQSFRMSVCSVRTWKDKEFPNSFILVREKIPYKILIILKIL